ncbi:hypothetical protein CBR_g36584 [Chara braunii]|uniref:DUF659 domain-containing protein n=1 Tax=Chara braunii TaxID=69332 RepID=A0A388JZ95_CHABU|nr:hypothetical protein CBR_g36584 [Chara braunii]|eukprot:GBG63097.1 hypothetical protein CBR_g36584 [Chara braunii]
MTGATILSDGRKSQDGRPIVNFLAAGSRGVVTYTTINGEGEPDDAVHVPRRWVTIFHEFRFGRPQRVNAICTDSASAYVGATKALTLETMLAALRRITWLPCLVHVCNKLLSDMGTCCDAFVDTITHARVLVVFFKTHQAALHFFRKRSPNLGLVLSCETRFASVYSMLERLMALQDTLHMMRGDDERVFAFIPWSADVCYMARWVRRQIRWDPWWQRVATIVHIMEPVMQLLRRMDRGGQFMSLVLEWAQDLVQRVKEACAPLGSSILDRIIRRVQARSQHMLELAHCAGFLLNPRRRHVRYFSGEVQESYAWLVRQVKRYILTQTGFELEGAEHLLACRQFEDFHMQQGRFGDWGGAEGRAHGRACSGDAEMIECASWWSQYGAGAPELQRCALRVMHMWSCASPAERNWAVHEGIHTKKRNRLAFEKVVQLIEITANMRLTEYRRAGCSYVLPWQRDEGMLDCQAGLEVEPVRTGTRQGMTAAEIAEKVALITRDPIGSSAPPSTNVVFERRACIFRPYPRDDDSNEEPAPEGVDDPALPIPSEIDETHEEANDAEVRTYTARRAADRAEEEMQRGDEDLLGPFGEVASTGDAGADRGGASHADTSRVQAGRPTPAPAGQEPAVQPPPAPSPAPPIPEEGDVAAAAQEALAVSTAREEVPAQATAEEEVAAATPQEAVPMDHDSADTDQQLVWRFITEEVDPVVGGRVPSRDDAADATGTQTPIERTQAESPDTARDIIERERARLMASSNPRAQAFARALEEARRRKTGGDGVQGGVVAGEDVMEGVAAEADDEAIQGGLQAVDVPVDRQPQAANEAVQAGQRRDEGAIDARPVVQETTMGADSKRGVPPRPRPVAAEGGAPLGESSGAEGLGMPPGSRRAQTVAEASARVVLLRKGGGPVTIEEDDPETDAAVREEDKDYEGEEEGEEESESGSGSDDDYGDDGPPPPPPTRASRRSAAQTSSSARGRRRSPSGSRGGVRRRSGKGKKGR